MPWFQRSSSSSLPAIRSRRALRRGMMLRKAMAAALVGCATWLGLQLLGIGVAGETSVTVLVAARDLPAGHAVAASDTSERRVPLAVGTDSVTAVTLESLAEGRILTGPIRSGELLSATRLRAPDTFDAVAPDRRAVHIPLRDTGTLALLHPGSHVDMYSTGDGRLVVGDVEVLQIDAPATSGGGLGSVNSADVAGVVVAVPVASAPAMMSALGSQGGDDGTIHLALRNR